MDRKPMRSASVERVVAAVLVVIAGAMVADILQPSKDTANLRYHMRSRVAGTVRTAAWAV